MPGVGSLYGNKGLQGLKAEDRSKEDKQYLEEVSGSKPTPATPVDTTVFEQPFKPSVELKTDDKGNVAVANNSMVNWLGRMEPELEDLRNRKKAYDTALEEYKEMRDRGSSGAMRNVEIQEVANNISPYYKRYKGTDYLDFTRQEWSDMAMEYQAMQDSYGVDAANNYLNSKIKERVASNQTWYEQAGNAFMGMGASAAGSMIASAGMAKAVLWDIPFGDYESKDYLSWWDNHMNAILDNDLTRYGNDVFKYGSFYQDRIDELKESGLSQLQILQTDEQEQQVFNSTTPWTALQSGGFTVASMFTGWGLAKMAGWLFKGIGKAASLLSKAENLTRNLERVKKAENFTNAFIIPGLTGTNEGVIEGLSTKQEVEEKGLKTAYESQKKAVADEVNRRLKEEYRQINDGDTVFYIDKNGSMVDINQLYQQVWNEFAPKYSEVLNQVDYASTKAGINNFYINSIINGLINTTLKAGLQADKVQNALRNNRLTGWVFAKPKFNITGTPGTSNATATVNMAKWGMGKELIKEPIGEATEEYLQTLSNDVTSGGAENNIHEFIENKYHGDGTAAVGDWFGSDWAAAWTAFNKSVTSLEAQQAAVMGALSSIMGTPVMPGRRRVRNNRTGEIETSGILNLPSNLRRGLNAKGEVESNWEYLQRVMPWRSGMYSNYRRYRAEVDRDKDDAEALTEWLRNPDNLAKFDGLSGTMKWAMDMADAATSNDEFGYRNSVLGKTINDAIMLSKIADSNLGQALIEQLEEVSDIDIESEEGKRFIQAMRDDVNVDTEGKTDEEIAGQLKKNALKMRTVLATANRESEKMEKLLGNIDDDTKQSLIYSQIMLDDWKERREQLRTEIEDINKRIGLTVTPTTDFVDKNKFIARHGSLKAAVNYMFDLNEQKSRLEKQIKELEKLGDNASESEEKALKFMRAEVKSLGKQLFEYTSLIDQSIAESNDNLTLSEEDIMGLDDVTRGRMLRLGAQKLYTSLHENKQEIDRLTEQIDKLETEKKNIKRRTTKGAKANRAKNKRIKELNSEINQLRKKLKDNRGETRQFYSDEQQAIIDNLIQKGMAEDSEFLDKIVDAGRIQASIDNFHAQRQAILSDPRAYHNYVMEAKYKAQNLRTKLRAEHIGRIQDYNEFSDELDRALSNSSEYERAIIARTLKENGSENWTKYKDKRQFADDLLRQVTDEKIAKDLTANDLDMLMHALNYLQNKDVDLNNLEEVFNTLQEKNDEGDLLFRDYVERMNDSHPEMTKTVFTSVPSVFTNYKNLLHSKIKQDATDEVINRKPEIEQTKPEDNDKPNPPVPVENDQQEEKPAEDNKPIIPNIFDSAYSSPDEGHIDAEGNRLGVNDNLSPDVQEAFNIARTAIDNSAFKGEVKQEAFRLFESLRSMDLNTLEDVDAELAKLITSVESNATSDNNNLTVAQLLGIVSRGIKSKIQGRNNRGTDLSGKDIVQDVEGKDVNRNNGTINTINIASVRKRNPNGFIARTYDRYGIDQYLREHRLDINTEVLFVTDSELTEQCRSELGDRYTDAMKPVLAVVEDKNGPIVIGEKRYQPIGLMPSTGARSAGSNRMEKVRNLSSNDSGPQFVRNNDGTPIRTRTHSANSSSPVNANHRDAVEGRENSKENNKSVLDLMLDLLTDDEKRRLMSMSLVDRIKDPVYIRERSKFISRLIFKPIDGKLSLHYKYDNLKNDEGSASIVSRVPIASTIGVRGKNIFEARNLNDLTDLLEFNSRTSRFYHENIIGSSEKYDSILKIQQRIASLSADSSAEEIKAVENAISKVLNGVRNFIFITDSNYEFNTSFDIEHARQTGEFRFTTVLEKKNAEGADIDRILMPSLFKDTNLAAYGHSVLESLLFKDDNTIRDFVVWQVPYSDVKVLLGMQNGNPNMANKNLGMIVDDNILTIASSSLGYDPYSVSIASPFDNENNPRNFPPIVANPDIARDNNLGRTPAPSTVAETSNGALVDVQTGTSVEGEPNKQNNPFLDNAVKLENQIREVSRKFTISDDENYYELWENGKVVQRFARVTKVIEADENGKTFPENSPYTVPSTSVGNTVDMITRDFFEGKFYFGDLSWETKQASDKSKASRLEEYYPNMNRSRINRLLTELNAFKHSLDLKGIHIIPNEVTVSGTIDIVENGKAHKIPVAGTLDLLGYDEKGNWYIFDMKTVHNGTKESVSIDRYDNKGKWGRQLSVYRDLLKQMYDIEVSEENLRIIPFTTVYADPGPNVIYSRKSNDKKDKKNYNQLRITDRSGNTREYRDETANMIFQSYEDLVKVGYTTLNLVWDKLQDSVKELIKDELPQGAEPTSVRSGEVRRDPIFNDRYEAALDDAEEAGITEQVDIPDIPTDLDDAYNNFIPEQKAKLRKEGIKPKDWRELPYEEQKKWVECFRSQKK